MRYFLAGVLATALAIVSACAVGPNYRRPQFDAAASYKEQDGWKPSEPGEAGRERAKKRFGVEIMTTRVLEIYDEAVARR